MLCNYTLRKIYSQYTNEPISAPRLSMVQINDPVFFKAACYTVKHFHQVRRIILNLAQFKKLKYKY